MLFPQLIWNNRIWVAQVMDDRGHCVHHQDFPFGIRYSFPSCRKCWQLTAVSWDLLGNFPQQGKKSTLTPRYAPLQELLCQMTDQYRDVKSCTPASWSDFNRPFWLQSNLWDRLLCQHRIYSTPSALPHSFTLLQILFQQHNHLPVSESDSQAIYLKQWQRHSCSPGNLNPDLCWLPPEKLAKSLISSHFPFKFEPLGLSVTFLWCSGTLDAVIPWYCPQFTLISKTYTEKHLTRDKEGCFNSQLRSPSVYHDPSL